LAYRKKNYGRQIVTATIAEIHHLYPNKMIKIGAQNYLRSFYESFGFKAVSDVYLEDNIPHIDMILNGGH
jgi:ElaA protein